MQPTTIVGVLAFTTFVGFLATCGFASYAKTLRHRIGVRDSKIENMKAAVHDMLARCTEAEGNQKETAEQHATQLSLARDRIDFLEDHVDRINRLAAEVMVTAKRREPFTV